MSAGGLDAIRSQLMTLFAFQSGKSEGGIEFSSIAYAMIGMVFVENFIKWLPAIGTWANDLVKDYYKGNMFKKMKKIAERRPIKSSVLLRRIWDDKSSGSSPMGRTPMGGSGGGKSGEEHQAQQIYCDALLDELSRMNQSEKLVISNKVYLENEDEIDLGNGQYAQHKVMTTGGNGDPTEIQVRLISQEHNLERARRYLDELRRRYEINIANELGDQLQQFEDMPFSLPREMNGRIRQETAPKQLMFRHFPFYTNKSLTNVYGNAMDVVRRRVRFFMDNRSWQERNGIPYTLGILMQGPPGCGKTSLIKAIANDMNRHVFGVQLSEETTRSQFTNFFYSDEVQVTQNGSTKTIRIPTDRRLTVMEEIDTMGAPVLKRGERASIPAPLGSAVDDLEPAGGDIGVEMMLNGDDFRAMMEGGNIPAGTPIGGGGGPRQRTGMPAQGDNEKLTLGSILQVFDGILETPGRIIIMTTNHPEKLDPALVRPGRVDVVVNFDRFTAVEIHEMFEKITGKTIPEEDLRKIPDAEWSAAQVAQKIFENWENEEDAIEALKESPPATDTLG